MTSSQVIKVACWTVWAGGSLVTAIMVGPFVVAAMFSLGALSYPNLALDAVRAIGLFGGPLFVGVAALVASALWFRRCHLKRAWLAVLVPYAAAILQVMVAVG